MNEKISRREFASRLTSGLMLAGMSADSVLGGQAGAAARRQYLKLDTMPGTCYQIKLPVDDGVAPGTRWEGGKLVARGGRKLAEPLADTGPLSPMYRQHVIWRLDDLADWCFPSWRRFCGTIEENGGKADIGINPGLCGDEVWSWAAGLDLDRFALWNHTWDHGEHGPRQAGLPYDEQLRNIELGHEKVKTELGYTMRAFGAAGIKPYKGADHTISDGDEVTYLAVRNHPDYVAYFYTPERFADRGWGRINSDGMLALAGPFSMERPDGLNTEPESRDYDKRYFSEVVKELYPDENPNRPPTVGNSDEMIWRVEHPFRHGGQVDQMPVVFMVCHPWNWDTQRGLQSAGELVRWINSSDRFRFSNHYEAYSWLANQNSLALEKTGPDTYRLEAQATRLPQSLELALPESSRVHGSVFKAGDLD